MKRVKKVSRAYVYEKLKSNDIIKLLGLFHVENVFFEIINIEKDSSFYKAMQSRKNEHVLFPNPSSKTYADIFISECLGENFSDMLDEIINSNPESLVFYLTDLPLEDFLRHNRHCDLITKQISACVFEIMFDESTFVISFNSDLLHQSDVVSKMDEIFMRV